MLRSLISVGGYTLLSRATGFLRDAVMAAVLGSGPVSDAFLVALRLPNHFRTIFAEGAFNAAFVPLYVGLKQKAGRPAALGFAADVLVWQLIAQVALLIAALIAMPWIVTALAPGFAQRPEQLALATELTRITFAYLACVAIVTQYGAMLNAEGKFQAAAGAPIFLNIAMVATLATAWLFPSKAHAAAYGVLLGGALELALLLLAARRADMRLGLVRPKITPEIARFAKIFGPAVIGSASVQLGLFADTILASFLQPGELTSLYYADRINQLPIGVVGVALGTVLLPEMSRRLAASDTIAAASSQNRAVELGLLLTLPCAAMFLAVPDPIMHGLFARGEFNKAAADAAGAVLAAYALGLPAFVLLRAFTPLFHARGDTKTPVRATLISVAVNLLVKLVLVVGLDFGAVGLALGTVAGAWVNLALLALFAARQDILYFGERVRESAPRIVAASLALGVGLYMLDATFAEAVQALPRFRNEAHLALIALAAAALYLATSYGLGLRRTLLGRD